MNFALYRSSNPPAAGKAGITSGFASDIIRPACLSWSLGHGSGRVRMKRTITFATLGLLLLLFTYWIGYRNGFSNAQRAGRNIISRDASDIPPIKGEHAVIYDPALSRQNAIPDRVK
jgi:hypothetical protein